MGEAEFPYPMTVIGCAFCGFVCTVWEIVGTGCPYLSNCPECGHGPVRTQRVKSKEEHEETKEEMNKESVTV